MFLRLMDTHLENALRNVMDPAGNSSHFAINVQGLKNLHFQRHLFQNFYHEVQKLLPNSPSRLILLRK